MLSGTPPQGFLTIQRPHENDSCSKSTLWWLAALLEPASPVPERLQLGGGVYTLLNKRFVVAGRENKGDLGRNPTYEVSSFFGLVGFMFQISCFITNSKRLFCVCHFGSFLILTFPPHAEPLQLFLSGVKSLNPLTRSSFKGSSSLEHTHWACLQAGCIDAVPVSDFYHFLNIPWHHLWFLSVQKMTTELVRSV